VFALTLRTATGEPDAATGDDWAAAGDAWAAAGVGFAAGALVATLLDAAEVGGTDVLAAGADVLVQAANSMAPVISENSASR
jgi:hypothetical protein